MKLGKLSSVACYATFSFITGFLSVSADLQDGLAYSETGTKNHLRSLSTNETKNPKKAKGKKAAKKSQYDSCHVCNRSVPQSNIITVDYLIVGAGPAGLSTAADLSKALKSIDSSKTIAVIEKESSHGGRIKSVDLVEPVGYEGPPLRTDVGASRMQTSTLVNTRRLYNEYGVDATAVFSIIDKSLEDGQNIVTGTMSAIYLEVSVSMLLFLSTRPKQLRNPLVRHLLEFPSLIQLKVMLWVTFMVSAKQTL